MKPHGALYNQAARDRRIAKAIAEGVARWSTDVVLIGLAGSVMLEEFRQAGFRVAAEAFADRATKKMAAYVPASLPMLCWRILPMRQNRPCESCRNKAC